MTADDDVAQVVASVGPLDEVVVLVREFLHRSGAVRAVAVVDSGPGGATAVVDCERLAPIEVQTAARTVLLPHAVELDVAPPALPELRPLAPFEVDAAAAQIAAPPGAVARLASAVRVLAGLLGGRNVAMAQFATSDPEAPLAITARAGGAEPLVLALGDEEYEMAPGWPEA